MTELTGDLRTLLAISRHGTLAGAARDLRVNHSTVFRRLGAIEERLGVRLFDRQDGTYAATAAGEDLLRTAERVETEVEALERRLSGQDLRLTGSLRLTAPDDIAKVLLVPLLATFRERYPDITLELVIDNRMLSLTRREADIALRPTREPPETLTGRRVAKLASTIYRTSGRMLEAAQENGNEPGGKAAAKAWANRRWIAWEDGAGPPEVARWLARHVDPELVGYRSNSLLNQADATRAGLGLAILPCFQGDADPQLVRVIDPPEALLTDLWLLTHPDLHRTARIRALVEFLYGRLRAQRAILSGA